MIQHSDLYLITIPTLPFKRWNPSPSPENMLVSNGENEAEVIRTVEENGIKRLLFYSHYFSKFFVREKPTAILDAVLLRGPCSKHVLF